MGCAHDLLKIEVTLAEVINSKGEFEEWYVQSAKERCGTCNEALSHDIDKVMETALRAHKRSGKTLE